MKCQENPVFATAIEELPSEVAAMDYSVAEMICVLHVSVQCEACRAKVYEILQNIYGVYTFSMDAEEGTVRISGKVNPNTILRLLQTEEAHAEVKSVRFQGEVRERRYYPYGEEDYSSNYQLPYSQHHWFDGSYNQIPPPMLLPPPRPPSCTCRTMLPPPPQLLPTVWTLPRRQSEPAPPPEEEAPVISFEPDNNRKPCMIM